MAKKKIHIIILLTSLVAVFAAGCGSSGDTIITPPEAAPADTAGYPEPEDSADSTPSGTEDAPRMTVISQDSPGEVPSDTPEESISDDSAGLPENPTVKILMAGDILLHDPVEAAARDDSGNYDLHFIFDELSDEISAADIAIVNQEVIIGGRELRISGYPSFNAPYETGDALADAGFDVVCHATNHALDRGGAGIRNTLSYWREHHPEMTVAGIHDSSEDADLIPILKVNGIRIAILNYTYGTNGISMPGDMPYAVELLREDSVIEDLRRAEEEADFTIVCPHWGTEYRTEPDSSQKKWSEIFRENGADLVIGTHPHVIEPVELFEDDVPGLTNNPGGGDMPVYYSLGNFVNWTSGQGSGVANRMVGGLAEVTLEQDDSDTHVADYSVKAVVCHVEKGYHAISVYPLSEYTEELAAENAIRLQDGSFSLPYCRDLCDRIWGDLWK